MWFLKNLIKNDNFKEVVSGSFASLITKGIGIILNYVLIFFISNKIGISYIGFYNILLVFLFLTTILCSAGLNYAIIPLVNKYSNYKRELYIKSLKVIFALITVIGLLFYLLSKYISVYLFSNFNKSVYVIIILIVLYVFTFFNIEFLRANKKITTSESLRNISFPLLILIGVISLDSFFENQFHLILVTILISLLLTFIPSLFYSTKVFKHNIRSKSISYKNLFNLSSPLMVMGLSSFFLSEASLFILKYYYSIKDVGSFTIIYKISIMACLIFTISSAIIGPKISELFWEENKIELKKTFVSSFKMIFYLSLPFFVLVLFFPSFFLSIFNISKNLSVELIIMLVGQFLYGITAIFGLFLMVTDKQKAYRNIYIISALLNLLLAFYLIPKFGVLGASITVAASYVFLNVLSIIFVFKNKLILIEK